MFSSYCDPAMKKLNDLVPLPILVLSNCGNDSQNSVEPTTVPDGRYFLSSLVLISVDIMIRIFLHVLTINYSTTSLTWGRRKQKYFSVLLHANCSQSKKSETGIELICSQFQIVPQTPGCFWPASTGQPRMLVVREEGAQMSVGVHVSAHHQGVTISSFQVPKN